MSERLTPTSPEWISISNLVLRALRRDQETIPVRKDIADEFEKCLNLLAETQEASGKFPQFTIEANAPATIVTLLDGWEHIGAPPDLKKIRAYALLAVKYMNQIVGYSPVEFFTFLQQHAEEVIK